VQERVEQRRPTHRRRDPGPRRAALRVRLEHPLVAPTEHGLQLPELSRLEPARLVQPRTEAGELPWGHGLQHVDLGDHDLEDGQRAAQRAYRVRGVDLLQPALQVLQFVQQLLEPQLVHLVDHDEQHLVVFIGSGALRGEDLVERQVGRVGQRGGLSTWELVVGHGTVTSSK
jgi:hypothetical protein